MERWLSVASVMTHFSMLARMPERTAAKISAMTMPEPRAEGAGREREWDGAVAERTGISRGERP